MWWCWQSDCGAVKEAWLTHHFVNSGAEAAAAALNWGHTDIDCGDQYSGGTQFNDGGSIQKALDLNLTTIRNVEASLGRRFSALIKLGLLDPSEAQPYTKIPASAMGWSGIHDKVGGGRTGAQLNLEAARQSVVMLKRGSLPWPTKDPAVTTASDKHGSGGSRLAVVGPLANSTGYLLGTYRGTICPGIWNATAKQWQQNQCSSAHWNDAGCYCMPTVLTSLQALGADVSYGGTGVDEQNLCNASTGHDPGLIAAAVVAAKAADRVVLVLGNSNCVENVSQCRAATRHPSSVS